MSMNAKKKGKQSVAFAYARYSSNNQREESIDAQLRAIRDYCEKNNVILAESFIDEAQTGKNDNRDNFQRMINTIIKERYKVDIILVHKFNRFARNQFDSVIYKKRLKDVGVRVVSVTQQIDDSPEGQLLEGFLEVIDAYYSSNLAVEVRKGLRENALNGKHTGGIIPLGLSLDRDGRYVSNKDAHIVKRIFEEYAAEIPKTEICKRLNREGFRNQLGNTFNVRTVYDMLRNEKYIGNFVYTIDKTEVIRLDGIIEPIISRDLWEKVQALCVQPVKSRLRHQKERYYLTGKTYCALCGTQICGAGSKRTRKGDLNYYYKCVGKVKHHNACTNPSLNKKWFEGKVLKAVVREVMDENRIKEIARLAYENLQSMKKTPEVSTKTLKQEYNKITVKQERLTELYLDGEMDKPMLDEKNRTLSRRKREIEIEIDKRKAIEESDSITEEMIFNYVKCYIDAIKMASECDNEAFMRSVFTEFVDKVVVSDRDINVLVNADFSHPAGGDNGNISGATCRLSPDGDKRNVTRAIFRIAPLKIQLSFRRKTNIWAKNDYPES